MAPTLPTTPLDEDDSALHRLGIRRRHERRMSGFGNARTGFSSIGVLCGSLTLYGYGLRTGGPALIVWGWVAGGVFTLLVGLALAEVCSALPGAGSLHVYAAKLARHHPNTAAWWVGWLSSCGQIALTAAVDFGAAMFLCAFAGLEWNFTATPGSLFTVFAAVLLAHALLVVLGGRERIAALARVSSWWHLVAAGVLVAVLALVPARVQSPHTVFGYFVDHTGLGTHGSGGAGVYICAIGLLMVAFSLAGFDFSARAAEETANAGRAAPRGIVVSIAAAWLVGFAVLTSLTFAIQDYGPESNAAVPAERIILDAVGRTGTLTLLVLVLVAQLLCGLSCMESSSRVLFAVSRDRMLPGSALWYRVNRRTRTPVNAVWLTAASAAVLAVPALWDTDAFPALAAFAALSSGLAVTVPVYLRLRRRDFARGPWHLGRWSAPVGWIAVAWTVLVSAAMLAPQVFPITLHTFDYAPLLPVLAFAVARVRWSTTARGTLAGPLRRGYPDEPGALDAELT
ncbi:amino acid permease [Actinospica durhamensis]|uniref:Amino acid permease n=1 Tax=Actinospica durhamensis TaxID=1508375 RepID=A0A941EUY3_9ACTN|nr:amino acid permease [Actinospica durhamensis]MBR7835509.1 amino acid permease [Actinospica durhamensis]